MPHICIIVGSLLIFMGIFSTLTGCSMLFHHMSIFIRVIFSGIFVIGYNVTCYFLFKH